MDLVDAKAKKKELEEELLELFTKFELDTEARLIEVEIESMETGCIVGSKRIITKVEIKVEL